MKHFSKKDIDVLPSRKRAHLINSSTGYKSANLIGTKSKKGISNLAIFSSVTHLSSNPPLLGFILRPLAVTRNTYDNITANKLFTVNHVNQHIIKAAHQTSAKYDIGISEFYETGLSEEYLDDFPIPYAKESAIKLGCKFVNEYFIHENECLLIIGAIEHIYLDDSIQSEDGWLNLEQAETVSISGLDSYSLPKVLDRLSYAEPEKKVDSIL